MAAVVLTGPAASSPLSLLQVVWVTAGLMIMTALGFPSQALAGSAPGHLGGDLETNAQQHAKGPVEWARYVEAYADTAAGLLEKS